MALYEYSALDRQGKKRRGVVEALSQKAASHKLRDQGLFPTRLAVARELTGATQKRFFRRVSAMQLGVATRQLGTVLAAGMPLDEALATVADQQTRGELGAVLTRVRDDVLQGSALHNALRAHSHVFPALYTNMVQVGESSGTLDKVLLQLADYMDDQVRFTAQLKTALTYPILMFLVGSGVLFFLLGFVVPKITRMLEDLDQALPLPTLILMSLSGFIARYWWLLLILTIGVLWLLRRLSLSVSGRFWLDRQRYRLPVFGSLALQSATARFARTTATLLKSGVPLLTTLDIVRNLIGNRYLQRALESVRERVTEGEGLAEPLYDVAVFPTMLPQMAAVGEKSGELEGMLFKVAQIYEHQVQTRLNSLMALLEPLMILLMGSIVGFIVLAVLLPIFQASQGMG